MDVRGLLAFAEKLTVHVDAVQGVCRVLQRVKDGDIKVA
jgi:hypothetical protein